MGKSNERSRLCKSSPIRQAPLSVTRKTHIEKPRCLPRKSELECGSERVKLKEMDCWDDPDRIPLARVVSELVKVWFEDALKEAKAGDTNMQVLVGQMYCSGYGVPKDVQKGHAWIGQASRNRSSAWKVSDKHPGYNASDSDEFKGDAN